MRPIFISTHDAIIYYDDTNPIHIAKFYLFTIGGVSLFACSEPLKEDGEYCFNIEEGETCPDLDTVNADYLPEEPVCSTIEYMEATDGPSQSDSPVSVGMEIVEDSEMDGCCYTATYREVRDEPDCVVGSPLMEDGIPKVMTSLCPDLFQRQKILGQKVLLFIVLMRGNH